MGRASLVPDVGGSSVDVQRHILSFLSFKVVIFVSTDTVSFDVAACSRAIGATPLIASMAVANDHRSAVHLRTGSPTSCIEH